jgi:archaellum component FlaC
VTEENQKSVFDKMTEALERIANGLESLTDSAYVVAVEAMDLDEQLKQFNAHMEAIRKEALKVKVDFAQFTSAVEGATAKPEQAQIPQLKFPKKLEGES